MTELISLIALCTSCLLLFVHYRNQIERRHGEIAKLRSGHIQRLSSTHNILMSVQMHLETARMELRRTRECNGKYEAIEVMPPLIKRTQKLVQTLVILKKELEELDTEKKNTGKTLIYLQSLEHPVHEIEEMSNDLAKESFELIGTICREQKET